MKKPKKPQPDFDIAKAALDSIPDNSKEFEAMFRESPTMRATALVKYSAAEPADTEGRTIEIWRESVVVSQWWWVRFPHWLLSGIIS